MPLGFTISKYERTSGGPTCPHCNATSSRVYDTRAADNKTGARGVIRRRKCHQCSKRYTTLEVAEEIIDDELKKEIANRNQKLHAQMRTGLNSAMRALREAMQGAKK